MEGAGLSFFRGALSLGRALEGGPYDPQNEAF